MSETESASICPLAPSVQKRNLLLFAACTGLQYFAAPVLYVGVTQASLCDRLGADTRLSNLPATLYFAMTATPALIAWASPGVAALRRNLILCYLATALMLAVVALAMVVPVSNSVRIALVILQGAVSGCAMPTAIALLWEAIGRGTEESRRGLALSLAFGVGPLLAVAGSLGSQLLLSGELAGWRVPWLRYPWNFASLFAAGVPCLILGAICGGLFVVPVREADTARIPFARVSDLCSGIVLGIAALVLYYLEWRIAGHAALAAAGVLFVHHFRDILTQRQLFVATVVTVLLYSGNTIPSNMNLYTSEVLGALPEDYAGYQNTLRFGFKVVAGLLLGWILTKTNPRAGILLTGGVFVLAQLWAIFATGTAYLIAFGIYGAGELVGAYAPNYILSASSETQIRRNMAFVTMLMVPAAPTAYLYGAITDYITSHNMTAFGVSNSRALGFQASFATCATLMTLGLILAVRLLPPRPQRERSV